MYCPKCKSTSLKVINSYNPDIEYKIVRGRIIKIDKADKILKNIILRRRLCRQCNYRWNTVETSVKSIEKFIVKS